ncbi:MAG: metalloregulator ArsR/SmtB family transcription factor [Anaerolineae bacterium]
MLSESQVVDILKALADGNRLQIFRLLLASDRTNSELMDDTGLRQNLLSHHLSILTDCGLVRSQRSIGDARRHYYSVDLQMTRRFTQWWQQYCACPAEGTALPTLARPRRVLFLCRRNTSRSLMAEALARHLFPQALIPYSAGIEEPERREHPLPDVSAGVLRRRGVSTAGLAAKSLDELRGLLFDLVITVCDIVHETDRNEAANFEGARIAHWSLHDPLEAGVTPQEQEAVAEELCNELEQRLVNLVHRLAVEEAAGA